MLKKIMVFLLVFISLALPVFAEKQEWIDRNFDFSKTKKVFCNFLVPKELMNGIIEHEMRDILKDKFENKIVVKLSPYKYKFSHDQDVINEIKETQGKDLNVLGETEPDKANEIFNQYLKDNYDLVFNFVVLAYGTGSQYIQGHYIDTPTTETSQVITPNGVGTVRTQGTTKTYVPGGNAAKPCAVVKFEVYNIKTDDAVWVRIDNRAKVNTIVDNTKPKDIFSRIISSFFDDFSSRLIKDCKKGK